MYNILHFNSAKHYLYFDLSISGYMYMSGRLFTKLKLMSQSEHTQNFITSSHQATPDLHVKICQTQYVGQPKK